MSENHHIVRIEWHIKGYHVFCIKPHTDLELQVSHDVNNQYDEHAMKVCCPSVQEIPSHLLRASASIEVLVQFAKLCLAYKHAQVCNSFIWLDLILYTPVNNLQLCQDRSSGVEPVLSKDILLKDTIQLSR